MISNEIGACFGISDDDLVLVHAHGPDIATVLPDPGGRIADVIRRCAARDKLRAKEQR